MAVKKPTKKAAAKTASANQPARAAKAVDSLDVAIRFVESAGSLKEAKAALAKIERIKGL